jgi:GNAT superfamily N-acetyltransferase
MQIRSVAAADLDSLAEIDGTIHSTDYLHVDRSGSGTDLTWRIEKRPLRNKLIQPNRLDDDGRFAVRQIVTGAEEGVALLAEHDGQAVALLAAQPRPQRGVMKLIDLRVDFEHRRQGLGSAMVYQLIQQSRDLGLRALAARTAANNFPAAEFLLKLGFESAGLDSQRQSNHDLVKEAVTLFWYFALD